MRNSPLEEENVPRYELVALFGRAQLVRWPDGTFQIKGGSRQDRKHAAEWLARFVDLQFATWDLIES